MKIALICEYFPASKAREMRGGVEARTYFIAKNLAKVHDVTVYSAQVEGFKDAEFEGIKVRRIGPRMSYTQNGGLIQRLKFMWAAADAVKKNGYDLVDGTSIIGYPAAWLSNAKKRVITYHDVWLGRWIENMGLTGFFGEFMERWVLSKKWDAVIAVSNYTKNNLVKAGVDEKIITVCPNGIDVGIYSEVLGEKNETPSICCVARFVDYKRVDDLINATKILVEKIPNLKVKLIGSGSAEKKLRKLVDRLGLKDTVNFLGYVPRHADVLAEIKKSDVLCLPSVVEGFGITVIEAMVLKTPYVASNIPAISEASNNGEGGLLFEPKNVGDLVEKLGLALSGKIRGGCSDIKRYSWEKVADEVEQVYMQC